MATKLEIDFMEYPSDASAQSAYISSLAAGTLGQGLIAHWKMNDNAANTTLNDSVGTYDATLGTHNSEDLNITGKINGGIDFYTTLDIATVPYDAAFDISSGHPFSITSWVKTHASGVGGSIINQINGWSLYLSTSNKLNFYNTYADFVSTGTAGTGAWHFYAITHDGAGNYTLTVDSTTSSHSQTEPVNNEGGLYIGDEPRLGGPKEAEGLDDLRFYNRVLTPAEISAIYNSGNGTEEDTAGAAALLSYSESTIKTQGSYALKGIAEATTSLDATLTKSFPAALNLTGVRDLTFDIRSSRTGANISLGLGIGAGSPIAHYKMNDNAADYNVVDFARGITGTASNTTDAMTTTGKINGALAFSGYDYVTTGTIKHNIGSGDFTWLAWVYPTAYDGFPTGSSVMANGEYAPLLYIINASGNLAFYWAGPNDFGVNVPLNQWSHVGLQRRNGVIYGFVNAVEAATSFVNTSTMADAGLAIAVDGTGLYGDYYTGSIDDVRVYNSALSQADIEDIYNSGSGTEGSGRITLKTAITPNIVVADQWQKVRWDLSGVVDADKNAITKFVVTIDNADARNTFYIDNFQISQAVDIFGIIS